MEDLQKKLGNFFGDRIEMQEMSVDALDSSADKNIKTLGAFSKDAEVNECWSLAEQYHLDRIGLNADATTSWYFATLLFSLAKRFDFGIYCFRRRDYERGQECLKEVLSRHDSHLEA